MPLRIVTGLAYAAGIAAAAYRVHALSTSGAIAATVVGAAVHAGVGFRGSFALLAYFATSSLLGRLPGKIAQRQQRGNRRDAVQVLANGGPAAAFSVLHAVRTAPPSFDAEAGFYGSLAAASADTWATEIGTRFGREPRSIATFRRTASGESGGVTLPGLAASAVASLLISALACPGSEDRRNQVVNCVTAGMTGSLTDSLLGAQLQERRWCGRCNLQTELRLHTCGHQTTHLAGIPAINNDVVNLLGVLAGGLLAAWRPVARLRLTQRNGSRVEYVTTLTNSRPPS